MKKLYISVGTVATIGIFGTGYYFSQNTNKPQESDYIPIGTTTEITNTTREQINTSLQDNIHSGVQREIDHTNSTRTEGLDVSQDIPSREAIFAYLEAHPLTRARISRMEWFQDFLSGKDRLSWPTPETGMPMWRLIQDATVVEEFIQDNRELGQILQDSPEWSRYLSGEILPSEMIGQEFGVIAALLFVTDFGKNSPEEYALIKQNPAFSRHLSFDENGEIFEPTTWQQKQDLIRGIQEATEKLKKNPLLKNKYEQLGFTLDDIYTKPAYYPPSGNNNMQKYAQYREENIFMNILAIENLSHPEDFPPEIWNQFTSSDTGQLYAQGQINPVRAQGYISELMNEVDPSIN